MTQKRGTNNIRVRDAPVRLSPPTPVTVPTLLTTVGVRANPTIMIRKHVIRPAMFCLAIVFLS
ncbi:MAG: hypothetical protein NWE89_16295 [Candidatus Bathyarchaeota archaeon]|nr:hypothetical protein [Candidatus Bathyarchaeota archaeon]